MKALVVGLGRMGRFHRQVLKDLGHDVVTVDPDPLAGADHLRASLRTRPKIVCVAAPIPHLAEEAARWRNHCQWLLVEKPMAASIREANELIVALGDRQCAVGYVERFNPRVQQLRRMAPDGIARATFQRWNDRPTDDVSLDLTSHDIDLARHLGVVDATYDSADRQRRKVRQIIVHAGSEHRFYVDLMAHTENPLREQWLDVLGDGGLAAAPADALEVLVELSVTTLRAVA